MVKQNGPNLVDFSRSLEKDVSQLKHHQEGADPEGVDLAEAVLSLPKKAQLVMGFLRFTLTGRRNPGNVLNP